MCKCIAKARYCRRDEDRTTKRANSLFRFYPKRKLAHSKNPVRYCHPEDDQTREWANFPFMVYPKRKLAHSRNPVRYCHPEDDQTQEWANFPFMVYPKRKLAHSPLLHIDCNRTLKRANFLLEVRENWPFPPPTRPLTLPQPFPPTRAPSAYLTLIDA